MSYWQTLFPLVWFIIAIGAGAAAGDFITKKTKRKAIGWPAGILIFIVLMGVGGAFLM